jgi:hypothetical protein
MINWSALEAIATVATAVVAALGFLWTVLGVVWAAKQQRTKWEDDLTREYRNIVKTLPLPVRLSEAVQDDEMLKYLGTFLEYFDLSNQQVVLYKMGRVSRETWKEWGAGIKGSLEAGTAFGKAWDIIKKRSPSLFVELRELEKNEVRRLMWTRRLFPK